MMPRLEAWILCQHLLQGSHAPPKLSKENTSQFPHTRSVRFVSHLGADHGYYSSDCTRGEFLHMAGVADFQSRTEAADVLHGPVDELRASNLTTGLFDIDITEEPSLHLTFHKSEGKPKLRLLSLERIFCFYITQGTGLAGSVLDYFNADAIEPVVSLISFWSLCTLTYSFMGLMMFLS